MHSDHLGSTVLEAKTSGNGTADQKYRAYGKQRDTGAVVTDHKFTGQKLDGTGLQYYNARYYDPAMGAFISPDTIVPDATSVFGYNRYMYTFGNPLRYSDPTGHDLWDAIDTVVDFAQGVGAQVGYNNTVIAVPSAINVYTPQANESTAMQVGRFVGNVVTTVQGGAEMITGVTLGSGGATACATGVGCLAGAPAIASGAAVVAHGGTVATISAANAGAQLGNLYNAIMGEGGSGLPAKVLNQIDKKGLPRSGETPFVPKLVKNRDGQQIMQTAEVQYGTQAGRKGVVDQQGRIWIKDEAHAGYPEHWDVQVDGGKDYFRVGMDGNPVVKV